MMDELEEKRGDSNHVIIFTRTHLKINDFVSVMPAVRKRVSRNPLKAWIPDRVGNDDLKCIVNTIGFF